MKFKKLGVEKAYPLDWRQAALGSFQPSNDLKDIVELQIGLGRLAILRPSPRQMKSESRSESQKPDGFLTNLISWYRFLSQEQEWVDELRDFLKDIWPDFRFFTLTDVGVKTKAIQLRFDQSGESDAGTLFFVQLSDGEKALIGLYMIVAALKTRAINSVFVDEPDNFVGLPELQPWIDTVLAILDENSQAVRISHHPEILGAANESGRYLWRDNHSSPTRVGSLVVPAGISVGEAVARGWASGEKDQNRLYARRAKGASHRRHIYSQADQKA